MNAMKRDNASAHPAAEYDAGVLKTLPHYEAFHAEILAFVRATRPNPARWLDTGCGTGTLVHRARSVFPQTHFCICDPSREMLAIASSRLGAMAESLGATDTCGLGGEHNGSFDVVSAIQCLHYMDMEGRRKALLRCRELLREEGLFFTFENTRPETEEGESLFLRHWRQFQLDAGKSEAQTEAHLRRYGTEFFPIRVREHLQLLRECGFRTVEPFWFSCMQSGYVCVK